MGFFLSVIYRYFSIVPLFLLDAITDLKNHYKRLESEETFGTIASVGMGRFFVELCVVGGNVFRSTYNLSDIHHHQQQQLIQKESILFEQLVQDLSTYTIIRGVTGIGKSHIASEIAYRWATGEILQDITYLFLIRCREINGVSSSTVIMDMLAIFFPNISLPCNITSENCCFIFDSLDEYCGLDNITKCNKLKNKKALSDVESTSIPDIDHAIYSLLTPHKCIFTKRKIIITGRPECCSKLEELYTHTKVTCVDILGFSERMAEHYIDNFFPKEDLEKRAKLKDKLKTSRRLELMSRIPIYLNIICSLYHEDSDIMLGETELELYVWQLAFLLQKHLRIDNNILDISDTPAVNVFSESLVENVIKPLAGIVYDMQARHKFIFDEDDIHDKLKEFNFDSSGLIMKVKTSNGVRLQFFHLTMAELLSATYLFLNQSIDVMNKITDNYWQVIITFLCGLQGGVLVNSSSPKIIKNFAESLSINHVSRILISDMLCKYAVREIGGNLFKLFMASYFAYQNKLSSISSSTNIDCWIIDSDFTSNDFKNFNYFLKQEPDITFHNLKIEHLPPTQNEMEEFVKSLTSCQSLEIREKCNKLELFIYEFSKCYGSDIEKNIYNIPSIKTIIIESYKGDIIDWLFLTDIKNLSLWIDNSFGMESAVKLLTDVHLELIRIQKTIDDLTVLLPFSKRDDHISGKSSQIKGFRVDISGMCKNKADAQSFLGQIQSGNNEVIEVYWKVSSIKIKNSSLYSQNMCICMYVHLLKIFTCTCICMCRVCKSAFVYVEMCVRIVCSFVCSFVCALFVQFCVCICVCV